MKIEDLLTAPESWIVRLFFSLTLMLHLISVFYDPTYFAGYLEIVLGVEHFLQLTIISISTIFEIGALYGLVFMRNKKWPIFFVTLWNTLFAISLFYAMNLDLTVIGGCFGGFVQIQNVTLSNAFFHTLLSISSFLIGIRKST